jgi:hypothetical protein
MILLFDLELGLVPYHLDLPALSLSPANEIVNKKPLQSRDHRHRTSGLVPPRHRQQALARLFSSSQHVLPLQGLSLDVVCES